MSVAHRNVITFPQAQPVQENHSYLQLSAEDLYYEWIQPGKPFSAKIYLKYLLLALKRWDWPHKIKVVEFCKKWAIDQRAFYRAKAALVAEGILQERFENGLHLVFTRDPKLRSNSLPKEELIAGSHSNFLPQEKLTLGSEGVIVGSGPMIVGSQTTLETGSESEVQEFSRSYSDLNQISLMEERERDLQACEEKPEEGTEEIDPEFKDWLVRKSQQLPAKPVFLDLWVERQSQKEEIRAEYRNTKQGTIIPPLAAPVEKNDSEHADRPDQLPPPEFMQVQPPIPNPSDLPAQLATEFNRRGWSNLKIQEFISACIPNKPRRSFDANDFRRLLNRLEAISHD